jgi:hypothetical protein
VRIRDRGQRGRLVAEHPRERLVGRQVPDGDLQASGVVPGEDDLAGPA